MTILLIYFLFRSISYGHVRFSHINYSPIRFKSHSYRNNLHFKLLCKDFDNSSIDEHNDYNDDDKTIILQTTASSPPPTTSTISSSNPLKQLICRFHCDDINSEEISELLFEAGCLSGTTTTYLPPY